jgi:hypothetical protein
MCGLADTARFRSDDPDELVLASLSCPICLSGNEVDWTLEGEGYDPSVECVCHLCEWSWCVYLTPDQALRLTLLVRRIV